MKIGCHLPVFGDVGTRDALVAFARRMEQLGYASLWASDHVVIPYEIDRLRRYGDAGVEHVVLETSYRSLAEMITTYERFASEVLPKL